MQHKLKPAAQYDGTHDSTFDAVRDMIAKETNERNGSAAAATPPTRPLALGLSHPELAPAKAPYMRGRPDLVADRSGPSSDAVSAYPDLAKLRRFKAAMLRSGWLRPALAGVLLLAGLATVALNPLVSIAVLALIIGVGVTFYFIMGYDTFWRQALRPVRWYVARHPDRAGRVHARIDRFACRWDLLLDLFPDAMVAGLYLPDVADIGAVAKHDKTPFDLRLSGQAGR